MATKREVLSDPESCLNRAASDEPIFVLRAKDWLCASIAVEAWCKAATNMNKHEIRKIELAQKWVTDAENWHINFMRKQSVKKEESDLFHWLFDNGAELIRNQINGEYRVRIALPDRTYMFESHHSPSAAIESAQRDGVARRV